MKKLLIAAVVGGLIIFIWSFLSWTMLNVHKSQTAYLENQDEVMACLQGKISEGFYFLPQAQPSATSEEYQAYTAQMAGKPWAQVMYHDSFSANPGMNMLRGYLMGFLAVLLLAWLLSKIPYLSMKDTIMAALAVGMIGYMTGKYSEGIWFDLNTFPDLIDILVTWTLVGAWLGWWLNRGRAPQEAFYEE